MGTNSRLKRTSKIQLSLVVLAFLITPVVIKALKQESGVAVTFSNPDSSHSQEFRLETAITPNQRSRGLMFRREMAENRGMLFVYPAETENQFWMKNTPLPLDIVFLDENLNVVGVVENTKPFSTRSVGVNKKSKYVVELVAGQAKRFGIIAGSQLKTSQQLPKAIG
jgi:uncharacterized protein